MIMHCIAIACIYCHRIYYLRYCSVGMYFTPLKLYRKNCFGKVDHLKNVETIHYLVGGPQVRSDKTSARQSEKGCDLVLAAPLPQVTLKVTPVTPIRRADTCTTTRRPSRDAIQCARKNFNTFY